MIKIKGNLIVIKKSRKDGLELIADCPMCGGKEKLEVNSKNHVYHCFRCKRGGKIKLFRTKDKTPVVAKIVVDSIQIPGFTPFTSLMSMKFDQAYFLSRRGVLPERAVEMYWGESVSMMDRIVIPIIEDGVTMCYVARAIYDYQKPKELSPPAKVANKSHFLYNLDDINKGDNVVVVEGIFDCEAVVKVGFKCVAALGSHLSEIQIGKLLAKKPARIIFMFDSDRAGFDGMHTAMRALIGRNYHNVDWVSLPKGVDPDEMMVDDLKAVLRGGGCF